MFGDFNKKTLEVFYQECKSEREKKASPKQREQGKKLAKEHGLQKQPPEKRKEVAKKGGEAKRKPKCKQPDGSQQN